MLNAVRHSLKRSSVLPRGARAVSYETSISQFNKSALSCRVITASAVRSYSHLTPLLLAAEPAFEPYDWTDPLRVESTLLDEDEVAIM